MLYSIFIYIINNKKKINKMATHGATLNGLINPNGWDTTYWFEFGLDTTYGTVISFPGALAGTDDVPVSADITDLLAETTYHFRLVGQNAAGLVEGLDEVFTTLPDIPLPVLPTVTTLPATNVF
jgi:hypothetical protein